MRLIGLYHYSNYCLPSTFAAIVILLPLIISIRRWHLGKRVRALVFLLSLSLLVMVCETLLIAANTPGLSLFWDKMMYVGIILYPVSLFYINVIYADDRIPIKFFIPICIAAFFFVALLPGDLFIADVEPAYWGWGKVVGPGYAWFQLFAGIFLASYCAIIIYQFATENSLRLKNEILCIAIATLPTVAMGCFIILILASLHITKLNIMVHAIGILWHSIALSIAMLSKRPYDVFAHLPWFSFEKRELQKDVAALIHSGDMPLDCRKIIETLNNLLRVDIAIHTPTHVYANPGCDPVFADFDTDMLKRPDILIRHQIPPHRPEYEILSRHKCDLVASLFCGGQYVSAVRLGAGLSDSLYSNYDLTLIYGLLSQLRQALVYANTSKTNSNPAAVVLHQLHGKVCSVQQTGDVHVYVVDHETQSVFPAEDVGNCRVGYPSDPQPPAINAEYFENIMNAVQNCPSCDSTHIYTSVNMVYILDHQKREVIEALQAGEHAQNGTHGCFECQHQWKSPPSSPQKPHVIDLIAYKSNKQ